MSIANVLVVAVIFGYAGWTLYRFIRKSKEGKCAACSLKDDCGSACSPPPPGNPSK